MNWPALGILVTILLFFGSVIVGAIKVLLDRDRKHTDRRLDGLEQATRERTDLISLVQNELKDFKLTVAENYVHREDFIRIEASRDIKIDRLSEKINDLTSLIHERVPASARA